ATLRSEVKSLQDTYDKRSREAEAEARAPVEGGGGRGAPSAPAQLGSDEAGLPPILPKEGRGPSTDAQNRKAIAKCAEIRAQISPARIELDLAQAAFRYRYSVVVPAEPPRGAIKPKTNILIAGATLASVLLAIIIAVIAELRMDRVVHRWQVERSLG